MNDLKKTLKQILFYSVDSFSCKKHKLLGLFYTYGKSEKKDNTFPFKDVSIQLLTKKMNMIDVDAFTKILMDLKDIERHVNSYSITASGVANFTSEKYLREYHKSIGEYVKNILQIVVFIFTIYFLCKTNYDYKNKVQKLENEILLIKTSIKLTSPQQINRKPKKLINYNMRNEPKKTNKKMN